MSEVSQKRGEFGGHNNYVIRNNNGAVKMLATDVLVRKVRKTKVDGKAHYSPVIVRDTVSENNKVDAGVVKEEEDSKIQKNGWKIWRARLGSIAVVIVATLAIILVGLKLAGFRTFTVLSGSMEPEYPVGAMIYVRPVDYQSLQVGDVISYVANDDKVVVTHRIAEIEVDENDASVWRFRTKGDANTTTDAKLVHYKNVLGTPVITIPFIGYFAHNIQQPPGLYIALVVGTLLLAWTFLPGTLEGRRKAASKSVA